MLGIDSRAARYAWSALAAPLLVFLLYLVRHTLFVFVVALMFAYLLYPLVDAIDRRLSRRRPTYALVLPFLLILGLLTVSAYLSAGRFARKPTSSRPRVPFSVLPGASGSGVPRGFRSGSRFWSTPKIF